MASRARYARLLAERVRAGVVLVQLMVHTADAEERAVAQRYVDRLDGELWQFRAYTSDYLEHVLPAESAAWHTPAELAEWLAATGQPPTKPSDRSACSLCRRVALGLPVQLPSPPVQDTRRGWSA